MSINPYEDDAEEMERFDEEVYNIVDSFLTTD